MGSGGGGSSGHVSHSVYLENIHQDWLNDTGLDVIEKSIASVMNSAIGASPYTAATAYNPDSDITTFMGVVTTYGLAVSALSDLTDWSTRYNYAKSYIDGTMDAQITAEASAFSAILDDDVEAKVLPRFRRGMQDINAVTSSAFAIGEAIIEGYRTRDVAKFTADLAITKNNQIMEATRQLLELMAKRVGYKGDYARVVIEACRIKLVAKKEELEANLEIDDKDAKWDLEVFKHGGNLMAAIGGGSVIPDAKSNKSASAIGGALSGAAMGAMMTPEAPMIGGGFGAVLGLASGLL